MAVSLQGRKGARRSRRTPIAEINVTPFVDVMLVLLIIFMVTAPLLTSGVPVDLPDSRANALDQDPEQITVSVDENGFIYVDEEPIEVGAFPEAVAAMPCGAGDGPVVTLRADRGLDYGRVMAVMGELNRGGCRSISLVTNSSVNAP